MKVAMLWIITLFPILIGSTDFSENEVFFDGSLLTIKHKAGAEGKLYFLDFYADWCASCQLMEETTFKDPQIVKMLERNYIGTKVNIENFDGIALKQMYDIYILPTILIFNSKGELVDRIEKAMQPSELMPVLKMHNTEYNKEVIHATLKNYDLVVNSGDAGSTPDFVDSNEYVELDVQISQDELDVQYEGEVVSLNTNSTEIESTNNSVSNSLFKLEIKSFFGEGFSVRMGAFKSYKEMLDYAAEIERTVIADKFINVIQQGSNTTFELYFGLFEFEYGAKDFNEIIGLDFEKGEVIALSSLN